MVALTKSFSLLLSFAATALATRSLSMDLLGPSEVTGVDTFTVTASITNTGDESLKLYRDPHSALHDFPENTFSFSCPDDNDDATPPEFIGATAKYGFNAATEFVTLEPGQTHAVTHNLAAAYNFTGTGSYEIDALRLFHYYDPSTSSATPITATVSTSHSAKLRGSLVSTVVAERRELARRSSNIAGSAHLGKRARFSGCSSEQQGLIQDALPHTMSYLSDAISYLQGLNSGSARYTHWFGTYSSSRKSTVLDHYKKIQSLDPTTYEYDCTCTDDSFAFVYANIPKVVHLCNAFWNVAATTGTDSKAGTIVHESSHFTVNGGTQDYAYGHEDATQLALTNPSKAIFNADSHEYFAENTPAEA